MSSDLSVILCTAGYDHTIRFWEALSGICTRQINFSDSQINRLCISPDKRFLAAAGHHTVKLYLVKSPSSTNPYNTPGGGGYPNGYNANDQQRQDRHQNDGNPILTFEGHTNNVTAVAFHIDTKWMVTSSEDGSVKIWDTKSGSIQRNYIHGAPVNDVVIHPNQGELISCDRAGAVRIWDLGENKCSLQLVPEEDVSMSSVTVASDGTLLCASNNAGRVFVWKLKVMGERTEMEACCAFAAHESYITRVLLSPDVKHLATCSADHTTKIWAVDQRPQGDGFEVPTRRQRATTMSRAVGPHAFSANGPPLSGSMSNGTNGTGKRQGWDLEATLQNHQRWVWDCAFSADSAYLVTACSDHFARLWELTSQSVIRQYNGHHRGAVCVALNDYSEGR